MDYKRLAGLTRSLEARSDIVFAEGAREELYEFLKWIDPSYIRKFRKARGVFVIPNQTFPLEDIKDENKVVVGTDTLISGAYVTKGFTLRRLLKEGYTFPDLGNRLGEKLAFLDFVAGLWQAKGQAAFAEGYFSLVARRHTTLQKEGRVFYRDSPIFILPSVDVGDLEEIRYVETLLARYGSLVKSAKDAEEAMSHFGINKP